MENSDHFLSREQTNFRVSEVLSGRFKSWVIDRFIVGSEELKAEISSMVQTEVNDAGNAPRPISQPTVPSQVSEALDFVIETYRRRRPHWTPEFLAKLQRVAESYLDESTYITIIDGVFAENKKILGTLRLIRAKNGFLPMERYLEIEVEVDGKQKIEPGNFAISKDANATAWPEIMMQLALFGIRQESDGRTPHYLTYADKYSRALYAQLGFTPVPAHLLTLGPETKSKLITEMIDGKEVTSMKVFKDGVEWIPMEASYETLSRLVDLHVDRLKSRQHPELEGQTILSRRKELLRSPDRRLQQSFVGYGETNLGQKARAEIEFQRHEDVIRVLCSISLLENNQWVHKENLNLGFLPPSALPLKQGAIVSSNYAPKSRLAYRGTKLTLENSTASLRTELTINPALTLPTWLMISLDHESMKFEF